MKKRSNIQKTIDFLTFPLRAILLFYEDKWGLSSQATERYDYVAKYVSGYCLDVGCGRNNRFITEFLEGNGKGIDVYKYEGLVEENIVENLEHFPFQDAIFNSVTFIANINHIPKSQRGNEISEAYRILKPGGNIIVTMGNPLAEILVHKVIFLYDKIFSSKQDIDSERGMDDDEAYFLVDSEIIELLHLAGFQKIQKKFFLTQWGLNHLFIGWK